MDNKKINYIFVLTIKKYKKMQTTTNTLEIKIYVGTYAKYNEGSIAGQWIDLTDLSKKEFHNICKDLHSDEEDPEYMFQDTDTNNEVLRNMISECGIDKDFWELKEKMKYFDEQRLEAFIIYVNNTKDTDIDTFEDSFFCYLNEYNINEAFGNYMMDITGEISEIPKHLQYYFDFESYGRDLLINDYWEQDGYIFINR